MRKLIYITFALTLMTISFTSCRDEKTQKEELIEEMKDDGAEIKTKKDGDETKMKMETADKSVKIKEEDGETKIKVDKNN